MEEIKLLDSHSKKLLFELIKLTPDHPQGCFTHSYLDETFYFYDNPDTEASLKTLKKLGYLEKYILNDNSIGLTLTSAGRYYKEYRRKNLITYLLKSIVTPIIVSAFTSLVVYYLLPH